jgi:outer membrane protein
MLEHMKSVEDVRIAKSGLAPSATLSYKLAEQDDFSSAVQERKQQTLKATATWPLYSGGSNLSSLKKAKELENKYNLLYADSKKTVSTGVANAWSSYQSSKSVLNSIRSQVKAAEIANEGITLEYESGAGNRTTLDVIQSRSILLNSRIDLATSEKDFLVSRLNILSAVGRLTAKHLNLVENN